MEHVGEFMSYTLVSIFAQNVLLGRALGTDTILNAIKQRYSLPRISVVVGVYAVVGIMIMWGLSKIIVSEGNYPVMALIYSLMCVGAYFVSDRVLLKVSPETHDVWGGILPHALINSILLGAPIAAVIERLPNWYDALGRGVGTGIGFAIGALIVKNGNDILDNPDIPPSFRGMPAMLIYLGILSLGFCVFL